MGMNQVDRVAHTTKIDAFRQFVKTHEKAWLADPEARGHLEGLLPRVTFPANQHRASCVLRDLSEDAAYTIDLIDGHFDPSSRLLEVGGGVGLAHAWLKSENLDITSLEPALVGHGPYFQLGKRILELCGLDSSGWVGLEARQAAQLGRQFDLIFSYNVLEHIKEIDESIGALAKCLSDRGIMRHGCPNYAVPYEPHFGIPLIPFAPRVTEKFFDVSKEPELWTGVNFLTAFGVRKAGRKIGLMTQFDNGVLHSAFCRFDHDETFGNRHPLLRTTYRMLKATGLIAALRFAPATLVTPMKFTMRKSS